jgi:glutaredoxin-like protein
MERFLDENLSQQIKDIFTDLHHPVEIVLFTQKDTNRYMDETQHLLEEVASLSDTVGLSVHDLDEDLDLANQYAIDKAPGFIIAANDEGMINDYGIRYYGIPAGHEFTSLINDLVMVSSRNSALSDSTREYLNGLTRPVLLQVFVTPTCQYCPRAVVLAHQMALESPMVQAEMVESMEFFDLANQFGVSGVPHTVINSGAGNVVGAVPEETLVEEIERALSEPVKL